MHQQFHEKVPSPLTKRLSGKDVRAHKMAEGKVAQLCGREWGRFVKRVGEKREERVREREEERECVCVRERTCVRRERVCGGVGSNSKHSTLTLKLH